MRTGATDDVELARRAVGGDGAAFAELFDRWFDRAFDVAWHIVRNRDTAAEVAQETFATAWQQIATLRQPESFGGWILRIARNKGLNRLAVDQRARPVGDHDALDLTLADHDRGHRVADDAAAPVIDRERDDLVWAAAAALGNADASLLSLHLRHGLDAPELADQLGIAANAAHQRLFRLKKRLGDAIGAWTLWQLGRPRCDALRDQLAEAGTTRFGREAAATIAAHARTCPDCTDRRTLALTPEALFAAVPLVAPPAALKAQTAAALTSAGVPSPTAGPAGAPAPDTSSAPTTDAGAHAASDASTAPTTDSPGGQATPDTPASPSTEPPPEAGTDAGTGLADTTQIGHDTQPQTTADPPSETAAEPGAGTTETAEIGPDTQPETETELVGESATDGAGRSGRSGRSGRAPGRRMAVVAGVVVVVGIAVVALATRGEDGGDAELVASPGGTTTTAAEPAATGGPGTTTTSEPAAAVTTVPVTEPAGPVVTPSTARVPVPEPPPPPPPEPEPEPEPPVIGGFRASPLATGNCADPDQALTTFSWSSSGATSAQLGPSGGAATTVEPDGEHTACAVTGSSWALTVAGDGGTATATTAVS